MITSIRSEIDRLDARFSQLRELANDGNIEMQHIYANYVILKTAGFLENSIQSIFKEYCRRHSNPQISNYIEAQIARLNSLNIEKVERLMSSFFGAEHWNNILADCSSPSIEAVNSVKSIRDRIAHGQHDGTGYSVAYNYYKSCVEFVCTIERNILD